jgi:hypothetical protein
LRENPGLLADEVGVADLVSSPRKTSCIGKTTKETYPDVADVWNIVNENDLSIMPW